MKKTKIARILSLMLCFVMAFALFAACEDPNAGNTSGNSGNNPGTSSGGNPSTKDSIVLMSEELSGLFNPFYATTGADMSVVGMTQIGMLTTDSGGNSVAGDDQPTVVKDFKVETKTNSGSTETVYTFVLKNGLKFSDGVPLTMNDVLFSMYENLDPVYTGSSTMYSIKIKGLSQYRLQKNYAGGGESAEDMISQVASDLARQRLYELIDCYETNGRVGGSSSNSFNLDQTGMRNAIKNWFVSDGYKDAVATDAEQGVFTEENYQDLLLADYENALKVFKEELVNDYKSAKEAFDFTTAPYQEWKDFLTSDITKFLVYEGYITPEYEKVLGKTNRLKILSWSGANQASAYKTQDEVVNRVFNDKIASELNVVLSYWGTANTLNTQYMAKAKDIYLHNNTSGGGELTYPNIEGIVSLGHTTNTNTVTMNGKTYTVAHEYNADGTVKNSNEYAVLEITVDGTDPKAIFNFSFTVAPVHYYTADAEHPNGRTVDIKNNKFGVEWSSYDFQGKVIQSQQHVEVPVGAGPFKASDINNSDSPAGSAFVSSNIVYFKSNDNYMFPVKAKKLRFQVMSSSDAIDKLVRGEVDYVEPQFTKANSDRLTSLAKDGFVQLNTWQLGYGYIGVNAGKVPNVNIRRAIMSAMQTSLALEFYASGQCVNIDWPMSRVSWAYPFEDDGETSKPNGHSYTQWSTKAAAESKIQGYMNQAGYPDGYKEKLVFTIAGSSITEHPTYPVFKQAAEILNDMGWNVEVKADTFALTKLSTGSLAVWAAAWGSTIDPDMYQVYHKNSTATSVNSWGYREIKNDTTTYKYEMDTINELSALIDDGRETMDRSARMAIYEEAMGLVLDLAVEMPVYQRKTLYAYNSKTIKGLNHDINPYSSPLEKIWEIELV